METPLSPGDEGVRGGTGASPLLRESSRWTGDAVVAMEEGRGGGPDASGSATTSHQPVAPQASTSAVVNALRMIDARTMVTRGDDAQFIAALRGTAGADEAGQAHLPRLRADVAEMRRTLDAPDVPAAVKAHFKGKLDEVDSTLRAMQADQPVALRTAAYLSMNLLLPVVPLAIPLRTNQNKFEAELVGLYAKTALMAVGSMRSPTATNKHSLKDHFMSRHYINVVQAAIFAAPAFVPKLKKLNDNIKFNAAAGVLSTTALMGGFFGKEIKDMVVKRFTGSANPALHEAGEGLAAETLAKLEQVMQSALAGQGTLMAAKNDFVAQGKELSPSTSRQVTMAADAFLAIAGDMSDALHTRGEMVAHDNPDLKAKLALAIFTTMVCATTTGLMVPDKIGVVDLGSDAVFTAVLMTHNALNPNVTRKDALEEFKSFAGLSLVMIALLSADRAAGQFIDKSATGLAIGSVAMAILNVTIPGPVGHAAGAGLEKLMNLSPADLGNAIKAVGHNALEFFRGMVQPAQASSVTIEEIPEPPPHASPSHPVVADIHEQPAQPTPPQSPPRA